MMVAKPLPPLSPHDERRLSVVAAVHPKTIRRAYRGEAVRSTCEARIRRAAIDLDFPPPPPAKVQP
jgi:hypothetical protein